MGLVIIGHRSSKKNSYDIWWKNPSCEMKICWIGSFRIILLLLHIGWFISTTLAVHNFSSFFDIFPQQKISILRVQEDWVTKKIWWLKMNYFDLKKYLHEKSEKEKIEWNCAVHPFPLLLLSSNDQRASWVQSQRWVNLCSYSSAEVWSIF